MKVVFEGSPDEVRARMLQLIADCKHLVDAELLPLLDDIVIASAGAVTGKEVERRIE